jgi:hypothetical protein
MLHTQIVMLALALATTMLVTAGCGNSSKSEPTTTVASTTPSTTATTTTTTSTAPAKVVAVKVAKGRPLTRGEWIAKGDAICARLNAQLAATKVKTPADFARALPQAASYEHAELIQLATLVPPVSKAKDWQEFLLGTQQWSENSAELGQVAQSPKFTLTGQLVITTKKIHEVLANLAKHDGFKECSLV